jgi:hypothetical protein
MITHAGARTRILYDWESKDISLRPGVRPLKGIEHALDIAYTLGFNVPIIIIKPLKCGGYCVGQQKICLDPNAVDTVMVHELAHFDRGGSVKNPHSKGFVLKYIELLHKYYKWDEEELLLQAHWRKLI